MGLVVGNMRYQILVKSASITKNDYGEEIESWSTLHTLRAEKKSLAGSKNITNMEVFTSNNLIFITHYRSDITDKMRIEYDSKLYQINNITEIGYKDGLQITVELINE